MTALLLLRHAESVWNEDGRFQGWADPPLSTSGHRAALAWSREAATRFDAVVSSDLIRARSTAEVIAEGVGTGRVDIRHSLREQDQGAWTGLTKAEVKRTWPQLARVRPREPYGGETHADLARRVMAELEDVALAYTGQRVLVVTHAGVIKAVESSLGCEDIPVPHLQGRWIIRSSASVWPVPRRQVEQAGDRWLAGESVPGTRTRRQALTADQGEWLR